MAGAARRLVVAGDNRYGWLPLYRRAADPNDPTTWKPFAQVFMIPVQVRNKSEYRSEDVRMAGTASHQQDRRDRRARSSATSSTASTATDLIDFSPTGTSSPRAQFVILADAGASVNASTRDRPRELVEHGGLPAQLSRHESTGWAITRPTPIRGRHRLAVDAGVRLPAGADGLDNYRTNAWRRRRTTARRRWSVVDDAHQQRLFYRRSGRRDRDVTRSRQRLRT